MKKILIVIVSLLVLLSVASTDAPKFIGGFQVLNEAKIYRVSARVANGSCNVIYYWWVDEWGRPIEFENYAPSVPLEDHEMLEQYLDKVFPPKQGYDLIRDFGNLDV